MYKFCSKCGSELQENSCSCSATKVQVQASQDTFSAVSPPQIYNVDHSSLSTGEKLLYFFIPIVGIVKYFDYKNSQPVKAKGAISMVLFSLAVSILIPIVLLCGTCSMLGLGATTSV